MQGIWWKIMEFGRNDFKKPIMSETETTFVKWSASQKRLRTAALWHCYAAIVVVL